MHVARPAATRADGQASGQVCLGAGGKRCRLFMSDMNPLQLFLFSNRVCKPIEGVARKPINPFHSRLNECIYHQLRDVLSHMLGLSLTSLLFASEFHNANNFLSFSKDDISQDVGFLSRYFECSQRNPDQRVGIKTRPGTTW